MGFDLFDGFRLCFEFECKWDVEWKIDSLFCEWLWMNFCGFMNTIGNGIRRDMNIVTLTFGTES